ncbi:MAG: tRNA (adenosine(37)-N6)-dimethylallyltransferase MiaA [Muribaculaceae bacterium]|nr:tRNA (adenosine(37)-N6)-dimethylallyltransferase MiaA [Muribaculaceae bacterium]
MPEADNSRIIAVVGPTASGKTALGAALARSLGAEIVSADSRQVYRGMDIGTGKDLEDYGTDVPYHLIDVAPAGYKYNLYEYLRDARAAIADIRARRRRPIIVGGTGMYVEALLRGTDLPEVPRDEALRQSLEGKSLPELAAILAGMKRLHNTTDVDTPARAIRAIEIESYYIAHPEAAQAAHPGDTMREDALVIGIDIPRDERRRRISERLHRRFNDQHMLDEVRGLLQSGIPPENLIYYGLEYKFLTQHILGQLTFEEMSAALETAIHQFAKRQMTWFRGMERRGFHIHWLPYDLPPAEFVQLVRALL